MSENDMREIRQLILDHGVKIEALRLEVRALKNAMARTDVLYVAEPIDLSELDDTATGASALDILPWVKLNASDT